MAGISCGLGDPSNGAADWSLKLAAKWYPSLAALLPLQKAADAAARSLDHRALDQASVERFLHKLPAQRRLVVIIDDLDRAAPEVVPHLLLALREVFDIRECAFVLALDPRILAKGLSCGASRLGHDGRVHRENHSISVLVAPGHEG